MGINGRDQVFNGRHILGVFLAVLALGCRRRIEKFHIDRRYRIREALFGGLLVLCQCLHGLACAFAPPFQFAEQRFIKVDLGLDLLAAQILALAHQLYVALLFSQELLLKFVTGLAVRPFGGGTQIFQGLSLVSNPGSDIAQGRGQCGALKVLVYGFLDIGARQLDQPFTGGGPPIRSFGQGRSRCRQG